MVILLYDIILEKTSHPFGWLADFAKTFQPWKWQQEFIKGLTSTPDLLLPSLPKVPPPHHHVRAYTVPYLLARCFSTILSPNKGPNL